jgi:CheY-like chemotaxis protein
MSDRDAAVALGKAVRRQRFEIGLSQEELADRAALHRTYISDVELGMRNISINSIAKLAGALGLTVPRLFAKAEATQCPDRSVEILLVEDNPRDVELTLRAFWKARITNVVNVARDGAEALAYLLGKSGRNAPLPGVVLLDLYLPKVSALEILAEMKRHKETQNVAVVVLTASNQEADIERCQELGVVHYLVKPVGILNFSNLTPALGFTWTLQKPELKTMG